MTDKSAESSAGIEQIAVGVPFALSFGLFSSLIIAEYTVNGPSFWTLWVFMLALGFGVDLRLAHRDMEGSA